MTREFQGDLFNQYDTRDPKLKSAAKKMFSKRIPHVLQVSLDVVVIFAIILILGFVIAFAVGYEMGRKKTYKSEKPVFTVEKKSGQAVPAGSVKRYIPAGGITQTAKNGITVRKYEVGKPYVIQAGIYRDQTVAFKKSQDLKSLGLKSGVMRTQEGFYRVVVGAYDSPKDARIDLERCKSVVKGCFVTKK